MNILVTGAKGFVGTNLCEALKNIRDGKDRTRPELEIGEIFEVDKESSEDDLEEACGRADFVFNLAGVNRPRENEEFMEGNRDFGKKLLLLLKKHKNPCPVMLSSSVQASLTGRFSGSEYGKSKLAGEEVFRAYALETGAKAWIFRFPNLFGKWCRPNYNSAVATFCHNIARDLPITVNDRNTELELLYIDDLVNAMLEILSGKGQTHISEKDGIYSISPTHRATLGEITDLLYRFREQEDTLVVPEIPDGSFAKKLYSTYLSYLPKERVAFELKKNEDERGSFTELLKTVSGGQFSVNVSKPGVTKGQHWHNSKWEFFIVVSGEALIEERRIGTDPVTGRPFGKLEFRVSGEKPTAVHMLPGYTHNIVNLSETKDLVTLMWANECFDKDRPDTFFEKV